MNVVVDADKAPDEVQRAEKTSHAIETSLEHVKTAFTTGQPISPNKQIHDLAQHIAATEKQHNLEHHKRYVEKLEQDVARCKMGAIPTKIRWEFHGKKEDDKHRKAQQGAQEALQTEMLAYVVTKQHEQLEATDRGLAQATLHRESIIKRASDIEAEMVRKVDETGVSIQQQQLVIAGNIEKKMDDISALIQHHTSAQRSNEELLQRYLEGLQPVMNIVNDILSSQKLSLPAKKSSSNGGTSKPETERSSPPEPPQVISSPREQPRGEPLNAISVLRVYNRSVEFTRQSSSNASSRPMSNFSTRNEDDCLTLLILALAVCCEIGLILSRYLSTQVSKRRGIPGAVSSYFLSDNIRFTDALGRNFRLCLDQTRTWNMLHGWLMEQFKDCPGSFKVQRGQFFIFDPRDPDRFISASAWSKAVGPRRRFQMGIVYSQTQLDGYCPKCGLEKQKNPLAKGHGEFNVVCWSCGSFYSSMILGSMRPRLNELPALRFRDDEFPRRPPYSLALAQAPLGMSHLTEVWKVSLRYRIWDLDLEPGILSARPIGSKQKDRSVVAYSRWQQEEHSEDSQEDPVAYGPAPDTHREGVEEQRDLKYLKTVWIRRDTRLHDAALQRDHILVQELVSDGYDPNHMGGWYGTPLIAAIVSGSHEIVKLLLDNGADPLLSVQQGHTPVSVAACHAKDMIGHLVFPAAFRASYDRPAEFQKAVDWALYESTTFQHKWHDFLLFIGANPTAPCPGPRESAFAKALKVRDENLLDRLIMVLWERQLLDDFEAAVLARTVKSEVLSLSENPEPWLTVCCAALAAGDAQVLVREINKRLRKKPDLYFRLNIGNLSCHPDMQRFWRDCENERHGIVVPPELAGI